jgi:hypothetical protein
MSPSPGTTLPYFGTNTGGSVPNMFFTSAGVPMTFTVDGLHTNETNIDFFDVFGYYLVNSGTGQPMGSLIPLFNTNPTTSPASVGSFATINLPAGTEYGLYIENIKGRDVGLETDYIFEMSGSNTYGPLPNDGLQHFAIFQTANGYLVGDQDGVGCDPVKVSSACVSPSYFDYNNIIVSLAPAPEPATIGLVALSFLVLGGLLRRKLAVKAE